MERLRVVDAHVHFWDPSVLRYPWLDAVPGLRRRFLPADYRPPDSPATDATVFIEANCAPREALDEVRFIERLAGADPSIAGIVAFVDLRDAATRTGLLDRLAESPRVVGVRQNIQGQPPGFALDAAFIDGVRDAGRRGLTFDLCVTPGQLGEVAQLVERCPGTSFVLDHCGKPAIRDEAFAPWAVALDALARHDHVACKFSGLLTEARAEQRNDETLGPYAEHALRCFGVSRMLYGSDWPVVTLAGDAGAWRGFTDRFTAAWSSSDRQAFYADNAIRLYGLRLHAKL